MDWTATALTLELATSTALILAILGLPLAYWLATTNRRGRLAIESAVALPLVLPPTVVGFYLLVATSPDAPLGRLLVAVTGKPFPFTFAAVLTGSVLYNLPFAVRPFVAAFRAVDRRLIDAATCLGASVPRTVLRVVVPQAWPGLAAGLILSFAHTVGEFGVILMLGGNLPGVGRTLALVIYDDVQALDYQSANRTAAALLVASFAALCAATALSRRELPL